MGERNPSAQGRHRRPSLMLVLACAALALAACGGGDNDSTASPPGVTAPVAAAGTIVESAPAVTGRAATRSQAPDETQTWVKVADEGQSFFMNATPTRVRYGADGTWVQRDLPAGPASCTNGFFGIDPLFGVVKRCEVLESTTPPSPSWVKVADEGQSLTLARPSRVRYGADGTWVERELPAGVAACTNGFFGIDPLFGVVKRCEVLDTGTPPPPPSSSWVRVADEWQSFARATPSLVRYGAESTWLETNLPAGPAMCTSTFFGRDPLPGVVKRCEVFVRDVVPPGSYRFLADEWQVFTLDRPRSVRYGLEPTWVYIDLLPGPGRCSNDFFQTDPLPGVVKRCEVLDDGESPLRTIGGTVSGLPAGESVTLELVVGTSGPPVATQSLTVAANGPFAFPDAIPDLSGYEVRVTAHPGPLCAAFDGIGSSGPADVRNVNVVCGGNTLLAYSGGSVFIVNEVSGAARRWEGNPFASNLVVHPNGVLMYSTRETGGEPPTRPLPLIDGVVADLRANTVSPLPGAPFAAANSALQVPRSGALVMHPSGRFLYVLVSDTIVTLSIDATTGTLAKVGETPVGEEAASMTIDPSGMLAFVRSSNTQSNDVTLRTYRINAATGLPERVAQPGGDPRADTVAIHPSRRWLATLDQGAVVVRAIDPTTGILSAPSSTRADTVEAPFALAFAPSGAHLYVTSALFGGNGASVLGFDAGSGLLGSLSGPYAPGALLVDVQGPFLVACGRVVDFYRIDAGTAALTPTSLALAFAGPNCSWRR